MGVLTDEEYEFAMSEGLDINESIPLATDAAEHENEGIPSRSSAMAGVGTVDRSRVD